MKAVVIEDAPVLVPNKDHENFTRNGITIPAGTELEGEAKKINGKRRGEPFTYRLFYTNDNQYIHLKKIKPMATTQVYLSADAAPSPTIVDVPPRQLLTTYTVIGAIAGAYLGGYISKKRSLGNKNAYMIGGAVLGFLAARYMQGRKSIKVVNSK